MAEQDTTEGERRVVAGATDLIAAVFADAVTDIRRRVVEEGWFGEAQDGPKSHLAGWDPRGATESPAPPEAPEFNPYDPWGWHNEPERTATQEPGRAQETPDVDFGR